MLTFIGPFVLLLAFSGRCIFLAGAVEMFQKFFEEYTDWDKLYDYMVNNKMFYFYIFHSIY